MDGRFVPAHGDDREPLPCQRRRSTASSFGRAAGAVAVCARWRYSIPGPRKLA